MAVRKDGGFLDRVLSFLSFWVFLGFDCGFEVVIGLVVFVLLGFGNLASFWPLLR